MFSEMKFMSSLKNVHFCIPVVTSLCGSSEINIVNTNNTDLLHYCKYADPANQDCTRISIGSYTTKALIY